MQEEKERKPGRGIKRKQLDIEALKSKSAKKVIDSFLQEYFVCGRNKSYKSIMLINNATKDKRNNINDN